MLVVLDSESALFLNAVKCAFVGGTLAGFLKRNVSRCTLNLFPFVGVKPMSASGQRTFRVTIAVGEG